LKGLHKHLLMEAVMPVCPKTPIPLDRKHLLPVLLFLNFGRQCQISDANH
jgi:hypothetical protein